MASAKPAATCVYCRTTGPVTADHVPPRCLFAPDRRENLITVPACAACNASFKLDDEYFRLCLSMRADLPDGPTTEYLREMSLRSLRKLEAAKFRAKVLASIQRQSIHSAGGIYLGEASTFKVDYRRLKRTSERIVRGLFAHFFKVPLPASHAPHVFPTELQRDDSAVRDPQVQEILGVLGQTKTRRTSTDVLDVWTCPAQDDPSSTFWYVRIVQAFGFVAFTAPNENDG